jgi:hypothetical protein
MSTLKLTYFDFDGGRGEPARLALYIGGIAFEDHRISGKDWAAFRDRTPFLAMPTLEVDGRVVSQSNSINRYIGKLTDGSEGFYVDPLVAFRNAGSHSEGPGRSRRAVVGETFRTRRQPPENRGVLQAPQESLIVRKLDDRSDGAPRFRNVEGFSCKLHLD